MTGHHQQREKPVLPQERTPLSFSLRTIVQCLLWVFVFSQPWDTITLAGVGALSRVIGLLTLAAALVTVGLERRFGKPNSVFWLTAAYVAVTGLSFFWTVAPDLTTARSWTYIQMLGSIWILQEFARTREEQESLFLAYCVGSFIPIVNLFNNFRQGIWIGAYVERYSSGGPFRLNADNLGLTLVIALSMAWYLAQRRGGLSRVIAAIYLVVGPVGVLLTGTRGAFLAGLVPLAMGPLARTRPSARSILGITVLLAVMIAAAAAIVPESIWTRISTIQSEVMNGGSMSGRLEIWTHGTQAFVQRPFLGYGIAAFGLATGTPRDAPHNIALGVLVEQGIVGFVVFVALLLACAAKILRLPPPERKIWTALMLSWLIGALSLNFEETKVTWLLFGLLAGLSSGLASADRSHSSTAREDLNVARRRSAVLRPRPTEGMAHMSHNY